MKKITLRRTIFLSLFMASFFLFSFNVNASTYNININPEYYDIFKSEGFKSFFEDISSRSNYYLIRHNDSGYYQFYTTDLSSNYTLTAFGGGFRVSSTLSDNISWRSFNPSSFDIYNLTVSGRSTYHFYSTYYIIATNQTLTPDSNTYILSDGFYSYSCDVSSGCTSIPTLLDFYKMFYEDPTIDPIPSEPIDNTPILTNFYSTVGNKVGELAVNMSDNYVYLAIIGVFILIFLIELIRRYLL